MAGTGYIKFRLVSIATPLPICPLSVIDSHALSSTCPPFAFWPIYTSVPVGILEGYPWCWVGTPLQPKNNITESYFDRHLSGHRDLITPGSPVAQLIRRALPPFRYVIRENSWMLKNGYQGRYMPLVQEITSSSRPDADIVAAGQDAFATVSLP